MAWVLDTIRATVIAPDTKALALPKWQMLIGGSPLQVTTPAPGITVELGFVAGCRLTIAEQPGRADLIAAAPPTTLPMTRPASLGDLSLFLPGFMQITKKWLSNINTNVRRVALFCTIWEGTPTTEAALDNILSKLPSFKKDPGERILDFLLQINRPRPSVIDPRKEINRLVQWSARMVEIVTVPEAPWAPQPPTIPYPRAQADIDINTAEGSEGRRSRIR
jgi:hypothetical protein